jgi:hypothetical protein
MDDKDIKRLIDAIEKHAVITQSRSIRNETIDGKQFNDTQSKDVADNFRKALEDVADNFRKALEENAEETKKHIEEYNQKLSTVVKEFEDAKKESQKVPQALKDIEKSMKEAGASASDITQAQAKYQANVTANLDKARTNLSNFESDYAKKLKELNAERIKNSDDQIKAEKALKAKMDVAIKHRQRALDKAAKAETWSQITNGRSDSFENRGYEYRKFGNALRRYGKNTGGITGKAMTKLGSAAKSLGGSLVKGGPILGAIQMGCEAVGAAMKMYAKNIEHQAKQQEFENQKRAAIQQRQLALTQSFGEEQQAVQQNVITKAQNEIGAESALAVEGNAIVQNAKAASVETGLKSLTDIAGGAFAAASQKIDIDASIKKFQNKYTTTLGKNGLLDAQNELADTQLSLKKQNLAAKNLSTLTTADTSLASITQKQGQENTAYVTNTASDVVNSVPIVNGFTQPLTEGANAMRDADFALANARLEGVNQEKNYQAQMNETRTNIRTTMEGTAADFKKYGVETAINMQNQIYDAEVDAKAREEKAWLNFTETIFKAFQKSETAAYQMGRAFGYNEEQLHTYAKNLSQTQITVSKWGKNMEDMMKLQSSYQETTGRNTIFSEEDFNKSFANGLLMGDDVISQLNAGMEPFNKSVADSNEMFYEMYRDVTKMGMSGKKYAKDLVNNLKLAEKYNFKGGVKSLMEMAKWAQNVRFNTNSLDGMLDKVQEGGLEGIIKQSAELQVLGGNFAMGSDPLAMAYESFMDPEGYAKRMNGMIAGQGMMDSETGEVSFGIASQLAMRQMAKSTGQDYKDVLAQAKQQVKVNKMKDLVSQSFDDDQMAAIANNAKFENGEWVVNTQNGAKSVSSLTAEDISTLSGGDDPTKSMDENIAEMRSTQELMKATQDNISARLQNSQWDSFRDSALQMTYNIQKHFDDNIPTYVTNIQNKMREVVEAQKTMVSQIMGGDGTDNTISAVQKAVKQLSKNVTDKIDITNNKLKSLISGLNTAFPDAQFDNNIQTGDATLNEFRKNRNTNGWLNEAGTKNSAAFNTMKELYENFEAYYDRMTEGERWLVSRWDPSDDVTSTKVSDKHKQEVKDLGNYKSMKKRLEIKYGKDYANAFEKQFNAMKNGDAIYSDGDNPFTEDGLISTKGNLSRINDGLVVQNGVATNIDKHDQVLAAKEGGPLDRMLDMIQPRSMPYDSYVKEAPYYNGGGSNNGEIKIAPISITINGSINVNGSSIDLSSQIQNDPNFQNALLGLISQEVSKKIGNTGKMIDPLYNRIQNTF